MSTEPQQDLDAQSANPADVRAPMFYRVAVTYGDEHIRSYGVWAANEHDAEQAVLDLSMFWVAASDDADDFHTFDAIIGEPPEVPA